MIDKIAIMIVDDHEIFRSGLKTVINKIKNTKVIAEASNGRDFLSLLETVMPDIVLLDIEMPVMNGVEATKNAIAKYPDLKIVALTMFNNKEYLESMLEAGAKGFLLKNINSEDLERAIETVMKGNNYYSEELWNYFTQKFIREEKPNNTNGLILTKREVEIIKLILEGYSNKDIADTLFISERTVIGHKSNLLSKTNCKSTVQLLAYVIKNKLVDF
jgi:DNA-binding NarL/FixJ family response regulator